MRRVLLLLGLLPACRPATQIDLALETDLPCDDLTEVAIHVALPADVETLEAPQAVTSACAEGGRIGTLAVTPGADEEGVVAIRVVASVGGPARDCVAPDYAPASGASCIVARRTLRFVANTPLTLPVALRQSCVGVPCGEDLTCVDGLCAVSEVTASATCEGDGCGESTLPVCTEPSACLGDIDDSGSVDINDLSVALASATKTCGDPDYAPRADIDGDGAVTDADVEIIQGRFGCGCPGACRGDANGDGVIDLADLDQVSTALGTSCGDPGFVAGADFDGNGTVDGRDASFTTLFYECSCADLCGCVRPAPPCPGDANLDGVVDAADISVASVSLGSRCGELRYAAGADADADGDVDGDDVAMMQAAFGACP